MRRNKIQTLLFVLTVALTTTAFAQGRHDEKPHGQQKPAQATKDGGAGNPAMSGGRHDERPHGMQKPVAKKDPATKPGEMQKKEMMKNEGDMGKGMK